MNRAKFLIIQTASIGDVILATPIVEALKEHFPDSVIDLMIKKGNEELFDSHPTISHIHIWDKNKKKYINLIKTIKEVRKKRYNLVIVVQRFFSSGLVAILSGAGATVGFGKNPWSRFFTRRIVHNIGNDNLHETERNLNLIAHLAIKNTFGPRLYPTEDNFEKVKPFQQKPYITIFPATLWFTKQLPEETWIKFLSELPATLQCFILGGKKDVELAERIKSGSNNPNVKILAGSLSLLESAALIQNAAMNYANDSAPTHLASAVNAPITTMFCSTIPAFGFVPLSDISNIIETPNSLSCRPCGLHGRKKCPKKHFNCGNDIKTEALNSIIKNL